MVLYDAHECSRSFGNRGIDSPYPMTTGHHMPSMWNEFPLSNCSETKSIVAVNVS